MVVIESTTTQGTYSIVTYVDASTGSFLVTKPTGLVVGEMLIVTASVNANITPPAGWTSSTLPNDFGQLTEVYYKLADAGDVAATDFTFTVDSNAAYYVYNCYRMSGTATNIDPIIVTGGVSINNTAYPSISATFASPIQTKDGAVAIVFTGKDSETTTGTTPNMSALAFTGGGAGAFTERFDDANLHLTTVPTSDDGSSLFDTSIGTASDITGISFTTDSNKATVFKVNVLVVFPQSNETATLDHIPPDDVVYPVSAQASVVATLEHIEADSDAFNVNAKSTSNFWTDITKPIASAIEAVNRIFTNGDNQTFTNGDSVSTASEQAAREWTDITKP